VHYKIDKAFCTYHQKYFLLKLLPEQYYFSTPQAYFWSRNKLALFLFSINKFFFNNLKIKHCIFFANQFKIIIDISFKHAQSLFKLRSVHILFGFESYLLCKYNRNVYKKQAE